MCGRFALTTSVRDLADLFQATEIQVPSVQPRFNIPPTAQVLAVRRLPGLEGRQLVPLRWGLIPMWAKDPAIGNRLINARVETAAEKPAFRDAFRNRRCLVLADGFFEWKKKGGKKEPYLVRMRDARPFAFAGLWDRWHGPDKQTVETCTILTTDANELVRPLHDRMPVILEPGAYDRWLDLEVHDQKKLEPFLQSYPAKAMTAFPVDPRVNSPRHDDPSCIKPITAEGPAAEMGPSLF
jgi:putative SOS response-associated peptidase YedK